MSKVEKDEKNNNNKKKKTWKGLLSACPSSGEIVEHLELDRQISAPFHARKDNFSCQLKKEKKEQQQKNKKKKREKKERKKIENKKRKERLGFW